jgi:hypothetical protein
VDGGPPDCLIGAVYTVVSARRFHMCAGGSDDAGHRRDGIRAGREDVRKKRPQVLAVQLANSLACQLAISDEDLEV